MAVITVGGDTDTIASIAGQIAGALIGFNDLPLDLIARLPDRDLVSNITTGFAETVAKAIF